MMNNNTLIRAEYYPTIPRESVVRNCKHKLLLEDFSGLGNSFAVVAAAIGQAAMNAPDTEGLYRCVFPNGVSGELAKAKDGSGNLGTIMNGNHIEGQARWVPVEGAAAPIVIDPVTIAIAVALMNVNKKLDTIRGIQEEILLFLHQDKQSDIESAVNALSDIMEQFRYNDDNVLWKGSKLTYTTDIKGKSEKNIIFYRKEITRILEKQKMIHVDSQTKKMKEELQNTFKYYQLSTYTYAYASFVEVVIGGGFKEEYLNYMIQKIREYSYQYRLDYTECYEQLESSSKTSVQTKLLDGLSSAGKFTGDMIGKIPLIKKGSMDEMMIEASKRVEKLSAKHTNSLMEAFSSNRDAGIQLFVENIEMINEIGNKSVEVLFDRNGLYLCS